MGACLVPVGVGPDDAAVPVTLLVLGRVDVLVAVGKLAKLVLGLVLGAHGGRQRGGDGGGGGQGGRHSGGGGGGGVGDGGDRLGEFGVQGLGHVGGGYDGGGGGGRVGGGRGGRWVVGVGIGGGEGVVVGPEVGATEHVGVGFARANDQKAGDQLENKSIPIRNVQFVHCTACCKKTAKT